MFYIDKIYKSEIELQRSKFFGLLFPLTSVNEVKGILESLRKEYPKANHYCYAYIFDENVKFSDDGEPSQTAGKPILGVLQSKNYNHILCVVVRYFGGIKLGAGGLLRAYVLSATTTFENVTPLIKKILDVYSVILDYKDYDEMVYYLAKNDYQIIKKDFDVKVKILIQKENLKKEDLINYFCGKINIEFIGRKDAFIPIKN